METTMKEYDDPIAGKVMITQLSDEVIEDLKDLLMARIVGEIQKVIQLIPDPMQQAALFMTVGSHVISMPAATQLFQMPEDKHEELFQNIFEVVRMDTKEHLQNLEARRDDIMKMAKTGKVVNGKIVYNKGSL